MTELYMFMSGAIMLGSWVVGLFFLRFWSKTRDRIFVIFAMAFWLMAFERIVLMFLGPYGHNEEKSLVYLFRLMAFIMILAGIIDKNREFS